MRTVQKVSGKKDSYTAVKFHDNESKKDVTYNIPIGTKIATTKKEYIIKKDGVYCEGKKTGKVDVALFNVAALNAFDANKDGSIDKKDVTIINDLQKKYDKLPEKVRMQKHPDCLPSRINKQAEKLGSEYYVFDVHDEDGSIEDAYCDKSGFQANFSVGRDLHQKTFGITFKK